MIKRFINSFALRSGAFFYEYSHYLSLMQIFQQTFTVPAAHLPRQNHLPIAQVDIRMERQPPPEARQMHVPVPCAAKRPGMEQSPPPQHALWHIRVPCEFHLPPTSLATHGKTWEGGGERARESRGVGQTRSMPAAEQIHTAYFPRGRAQ